MEGAAKSEPSLPEPPNEYYTKHEGIQKILDKLQSVTTLADRLKWLNKLRDHTKEDTRLVSSLLYHYYINIDSRNSMRTSILRGLTAIAKDDAKQSSMCFALNEYLDKYILSDNKKIEHSSQIVQLNSLCTTIPFGTDVLRSNCNVILLGCHNFLDQAMTTYNGSGKDHSTHIALYNVVKLWLSITQQNIIPADYSTPAKQLGYLFEVIMDNVLGFDVRSNAGILFFFCAVRPVNDTTPEDLAKHPWIANKDSCTRVSILSQIKPFLVDNVLGTLAVYMGAIVNAGRVHLDKWFDETANLTLAQFVFYDLMRLCEGSSLCWVEGTRVMLALAKCKYAMTAELFRKVMKFCVQNMDYSVDAARHSLKNIYKEVMVMVAAKVKGEDGDKADLLKVVDSLVVEINTSEAYHYIIPIAEEFGCVYVFRLLPSLQADLLRHMRDETVAQHMFTTYRSLMNLHRKHIAQATTTTNNTTSEKEEEEDNPAFAIWRTIWCQPLVEAIRAPDETCGTYVRVPHFHTLFTDAFKMDCLVVRMQGAICMEYDGQLETLVRCLQFCYRGGVQTDMCTKDTRSTSTLWRNLFPHDTLERLAHHSSPHVRIAALSLVVDTARTTAPYTAWETAWVRRYLQMHGREPCPAARHQMISLFEKAIRRAVDSREVALRQVGVCHRAKKMGAAEVVGGGGDGVVATEQVGICHDFLSGLYSDAAASAVADGSCHVRRTTSFHLVSLLQRDCGVGCEGASPTGLGAAVADSDAVAETSRTLALGAERQMVGNGYEVIVSGAYMVLLRMGTGLTRKFLERTDHTRRLLAILTQASSIRATDTVSAAYQLCEHLRYDDIGPTIPELYQLLRLTPDPSYPRVMPTIASFIALLGRIVEDRVAVIERVRLHAEVGVAEGGVEEESGCPQMGPAFFGLLGCVRVLMREYHLDTALSPMYWRYLLTALTPLLCVRIPAICHHVIGDSAPEGFLPYDTTHATEGLADISNNSQRILVFAWRSVKEVSLLLGEICVRCPELSESEEGFTMIGDYFVRLFFNAKHRGAYEQASVGFQQVCKRLWSLILPSGHAWPEAELAKVTYILHNQATSNVQQLCPTRRSAGIPFLVQTVLATEPPARNNHSLNATINQLLNCANLSELTRLHAMNLLRALFRHNELGDAVIPFISEATILALRAYGDESWAIRNSATLLFAALMTRMFGVQRSREYVSKRNQMTYSGFHTRYAVLGKFVLDEVKRLSASDVMDEQVMQPILMVLSRLFNCTDRQSADAIVIFLRKCGSNPSYKTRELAGEVLTTLLPDNKRQDILDAMLAELYQAFAQNTCRGNTLHGLILQMSLLFNAKAGAYCAQLDMDAYIGKTLWIIVYAGRRVDYCSATEYVELCHHFVSLARTYTNIEKLLKVLLYTMKEKKDDRHSLRVRYCTARLSLVLHILCNMRALFTNLDGQPDATDIRLTVLVEVLTSSVDPAHNHMDAALFVFNVLNAPFAESASSGASLYMTGELAVPFPVRRIVTQLTSVEYDQVFRGFIARAKTDHVLHWLLADGEIYTAVCFYLHNAISLTLPSTPITRDQQAAACQVLCIVEQHMMHSHRLKYIQRQQQQYSLGCAAGGASGGDVHATCTSLETYARYMIIAGTAKYRTAQLSACLPNLMHMSATLPPCVRVAVFNVCRQLVEHMWEKERQREVTGERMKDIEFREFLFIWDTIIILLGDEDEDVRKHASSIYKYMDLNPKERYFKTPEATIEIIFRHWADKLPEDMAIIFYLFHVLYDDFEKGIVWEDQRVALLAHEKKCRNTTNTNTTSNNTNQTDDVQHTAVSSTSQDVATADNEEYESDSSESDEETVPTRVMEPDDIRKFKIFEESDDWHYHEKIFSEMLGIQLLRELLFDIPNFNFNRDEIFAVERIQLATNRLMTVLNKAKVFVPPRLHNNLINVLEDLSMYLAETPVESFRSANCWENIAIALDHYYPEETGDVVTNRVKRLMYNLYVIEVNTWKE